MVEFIKTNQKMIQKIVLAFFSLLFFYIFFKYLFTYIAPFFFGWLLSLLFYPLVTFLNKKCRLSRSLGSLLCILLFIGFFSSVVAGLIYRLSEEAKMFYMQLPDYIESLQIALTQLNDKFQEIFAMMPLSLQSLFLNNNTTLWDILSPLLKNVGGSGSIHFVLGIPNILMIFIISLIASFFFTKDRNEIYAFCAKHMPKSMKENYSRLRQNLGLAFLGYIKSQFILMVVTFFICSIGFFLLGSPYSLLLSVIISIIDALPFFGSGFILWPMALIQLISGNTFLSIGYLILYAVATLIRQVLQPKVLGTQIGLHPLVTLISIYVGLKAIGVSGMIIGPIIVVLLKAAFQIHNADITHTND